MFKSFAVSPLYWLLKYIQYLAAGKNIPDVCQSCKDSTIL